MMNLQPAELRIGNGGFSIVGVQGLTPEQQQISQAARDAGIPNEVVEAVGMVATGTAIGGPIGGAVGLGIVVGKWLGGQLFGGKSFGEAMGEAIGYVQSLPPTVSLKDKRDLLLALRKYCGWILSGASTRAFFGNDARKCLERINALLSTRPPQGYADDVPGAVRAQFLAAPDAGLVQFINHQIGLLSSGRPGLNLAAIQDQIFMAQVILEDRAMQRSGAIAGLRSFEPFRRYRSEGESFGVRDAYLEGLDAISGAVMGKWEGVQWLWDEYRPRYGVRPEGEAFTMRQAYGQGIAAQEEITA